MSEYEKLCRFWMRMWARSWKRAMKNAHNEPNLRRRLMWTEAAANALEAAVRQRENAKEAAAGVIII